MLIKFLAAAAVIRFESLVWCTGHIVCYFVVSVFYTTAGRINFLLASSCIANMNWRC